MRAPSLLSALDKMPLQGPLTRLIHRKNAYICLLYHRVTGESEKFRFVNRSTRVPQREFRTQMQFVRNHCSPISLSHMVERVQNGVMPDGPYVAVSFDDGYMDNYTHAFPVIRDLDIPVTIFLTTGFMDEPGRLPWWDALERMAGKSQGLMEISLNGETHHFDLQRPGGRLAFYRTLSKHVKQSRCNPDVLLDQLAQHLPVDGDNTNAFMRWDQARQMAASRLVDLAPHTCWHPDLSLPTHGVYEEIGHSRERILEETGSAADLFAYPFGSYPGTGSETLFKYLGSLGLKAAFLTAPGALNPLQHEYMLPRVAISGLDTMPVFLLRLWSPRPAYGLRKIMRRLPH